MKNKSVGWPKQGRKSQSREDLRSEMSIYAEGKGRSVTSARRYLRTMGMNITPHGKVVFGEIASVEVLSVKVHRKL